ncbi:MAG: FtsX-like permease family protein [Acidimicrobiales bacterium]
MFRTALKDLSKRKLRLLAAGIAVILGITFIAGTYVLTDTVGRSFDDLFSSVYKGTDAVVRSNRTANTGDFGGGQKARAQIPASLLETVAKVPGVRSAAPDINGYAQLLDKQGDPIGNPRNGAPTLGQSWSNDKALNPFTLTSGHAPEGPGQVVIDRRSASKGPFKVGDPITVLTQSGVTHETVVGIVRFGATDSPGGASVTIFTLDEAAKLLGQPGMVDDIAVTAQSGVSQADVAHRVGAVLPKGTEAVTGATLIKETQDQIHKGLGFFQTILQTFGYIALVVGGFVIINTFSIMVGQRTRQLALLRALGASRRQVMLSVLVEALVTGVLASAIGLGLGIAAGRGLMALLSGIGLALPSASIVVEPRTVIVSMVVGVVITVVAAMMPAYRASKVAPLAAMRDTAVDDAGHSRGRVVAGLVLLAVAAVFIGFGISGHSALNTAGGAFVVLLSFIVLGPVLAHGIGSGIGWPIQAARGIVGRVARQNTVRNPRRTASTAAALMIGVTLVVLITVLASSLKGSLHKTVNTDFHGQFVVSSNGAVIPDQIVDQLDKLPQLGAVVPLTDVPFKTASTKRGVATNPTALAKVFDIHVKAGSLSTLGTDGVAVIKSKADSAHLHIGSKLTTTYLDGTTHTFTVRAIFDSKVFQTQLIIDRRAAVGANRQTGVQRILIQDAPGVSSNTAHKAIKAVTTQYPTAQLQTSKEFADGIGNQLDTLLNVVYALLALAVIIALIGITNTLGLSILERTRELGLLRAVGMSRSQVRSTVRWEAVLIAAAGTVLGLVLGVGCGIAILNSLPSSAGLTAVIVPGGRLVVIAVIGLLVGVIAAIWPARRASKLDILAAVATE